MVNRQTSDESAPDEATNPIPNAGGSKARSAAMFVLSMVLLVGAGYFVYTATDGLEGVWDSVRTAPWWMIALIILGPMGNHISVALCLQALQSRHGKVGIIEMYVLVGSAWLFNYMPMRPGLIGRIGYHKSINNIRLRDSLESSVWSGILAGIANGLMLPIAFLMMMVPQGWSLLLPFVPVVVAILLSMVLAGRRKKLIILALAYRQLDVIVWLGRYWLAFEVLGLDVSIGDIAVISAVSQLASLMPLTGSGIGFREWAVGLMASAGGHAMGTAMAGDLINRAAETFVVVPVGLVCTALVARHWKGIRDGRIVLETELAEGDSRTDSKDKDESRDSREQDQPIG
ncbi:MAG: hypothetical protein P1U30_05450 [Phycisphaerales bacterium]|nr:hypothetical protein [Phycisphaerales bacterium]